MVLTAEDVWHDVADFDVARHRKPGAPDSLRVEYLIDGKVIREWVCLDHVGRARKEAVIWWHTRVGTEVPDTVDDAMARRVEIPAPSGAVIVRDGKYHRVKRVRFAQAEAAE